MKAATLPASTLSSIALTGPTAEGVSESERYPIPTRASAPSGCDAISPQTVTGLPCSRLLSAIALERPQHGCRYAVETIGYPRISAIRGIKELDEIVGADGEKIHPLQQFVELIKQRWHLDHGAHLDMLGQLVRMAAQMGQLALHEGLGFIEFLDGRDHWKHHMQVASACCAQQGPDLAAQQAGPIQPKRIARQPK